MQTVLPWAIATVSVVLLLGGGLFLLRQRSRRTPTLPTEWPLSARPIFGTDERRVYRHLHEALPQQLVLSRLPLVRLCQPTDPRQLRYWYRLLGALHVDFAVCSANGRVLLVIDIEGTRPMPGRALQIKESVLAACRVRYLRCPADRLPLPAELQALVPQTGSAAAGTQPASAPMPLEGVAPARRHEQLTHWRESMPAYDSFFFTDSGPAALGTTGGEGAEQGRMKVDEGGAAVDTRRSSTRS
ncbi:conserved hypothetical protein [Rubrivivax sp. A210]|uniref:DUF2726 domain-containing protein n=1 Tax=Rubrivivax sp. A210 TaxID=2772301 RepID=UPI00191A3FAC|nr:DUF2726 domain-containing protein [Rubrivivax sp. A210]CAD5374310.1 conserved hypothetical protein [Rubrivivax sp. A210]